MFKVLHRTPVPSVLFFTGPTSIHSVFTAIFRSVSSPSTRPCFKGHYAEAWCHPITSQTKGPPVFLQDRDVLLQDKLKVAKAEFDHIAAIGESSAPRIAAGRRLSIWFLKAHRVIGDHAVITVLLTMHPSPDRYPVPHIHDITSSLHGRTVFSKVEFNQSVTIRYMSNRVTFPRPPSLHRSVCLSSWGCHSVCAMRPRHSSASLIKSYVGLTLFLHTLMILLIASHSAEEHELHLSYTFWAPRPVWCGSESCKMRNLVFPSLHFPRPPHWPNMEFGRFTRKTDAIQHFPIPVSTKKLREFLGLVNFYRRFIPTLCCLDTATHRPGSREKPKKVLELPRTQQFAAFEAVKLALANANPICRTLVSDTELCLMVDASRFRSGWSPTNSRSMGELATHCVLFTTVGNPRRQKYSTFGRETVSDLPCHFAIFRHVVEGSHLLHLHRSQSRLNPMHSQQVRIGTPPREIRQTWLRVAVHIWHQDMFQGKNTTKLLTPCHAISLNTFSPKSSTPIDYLVMAAHQAQGRGITPTQTAVRSPVTGCSTTHQQQPPCLVDMSTGDTSTICFPRQLRRTAFDSLHSLSHPEIWATLKLVGTRFVWPNMNHDVSLVG